MENKGNCGGHLHRNILIVYKTCHFYYFMFVSWFGLSFEFNNSKFKALRVVVRYELYTFGTMCSIRRSVRPFWIVYSGYCFLFISSEIWPFIVLSSFYRYFIGLPRTALVSIYFPIGPRSTRPIQGIGGVFLASHSWPMHKNNMIGGFYILEIFTFISACMYRGVWRKYDNYP